MQHASIDYYEKSRSRRRDEYEMVLTKNTRRDMLVNDWGFTHKDLAESVRENIQTKHSRRRTINNLGRPERFEEAMENLGRKMKRAFKLKKSSKEEALQMQKEGNRVASTLERISEMTDQKQPQPSFTEFSSATESCSAGSAKR